MSNLLKALFSSGPELVATEVVVRLFAAMVCGGAAAWVYSHSRQESDLTPSFPKTIVLLAILIAMVTQVVGENQAKQGTSIDASYEIRLRKDRSADDLVRTLNKVEGVHDVELQRRGIEET